MAWNMLTGVIDYIQLDFIAEYLQIEDIELFIIELQSIKHYIDKSQSS